MNWSPFQKQAITGNGGTILVSAAAGSGKTAVLVQRIIEKIIDSQNNINIDELLIVTFSNAAAAEIKERISNKINELLSLDPLNSHLQKQQILLESSNISTIHSFCQTIIKENFESLSISPDFKICSEYQANIMKQKAFSEIIDEFYKIKTFDDFLKITDTTYNQDKLFEIIKNIFDFLMALPFPEVWMEKILNSYKTFSEGDQKSATSFLKIVLEHSFNLTLQAKNIILKCLDLASFFENFTAYETNLNEKLEFLDSLSELISAGDLNEIFDFINKYNIKSLPRSKKDADPETKENLKMLHEQFKSIIKNLKTNYFCSNKEEIISDILYTREIIGLLFDIIKRFKNKYSEIKESRNYLDFSDLEQLASRLLLINDNGEIKNSPVSEVISKNFKEIFIDEYQDTNLIQEYIFKSVSNNESNLFMVGDAKQSIYRFRQAMPELFIAKNNSYKNFDGLNFPAKISLNQNFRSSSSVTSFVNFIFKQLMSETIGEIEYDDSQILIPASSDEDENNITEICLIKTDDKLSSENKLYNEAVYIATKIKEMVELKTQINKNGNMSEVTYDDFCILLRSPNDKIKHFVKAFSDLNIPLSAEFSNNFFESPEISTIMSLLKIINNPLDDISMLAVMFSNIFAFSPDDVLNLKAYKLPSFFEAIKEDMALNKDSKKLFDYITYFKNLANILPIDRLIYEIYNKTDLYNIVNIKGSDTRHQDNLDLFKNIAKEFSESGSSSLIEFIHYLDNISKQKSAYKTGALTSSGKNCVKIMSIHKSKGLEFPICILADSSRQINKVDIKSSILYHPSLGFGINRFDSGFKYSTLLKNAIKLQIENNMISEELRILYVALTRAKNKLMIVIFDNNYEERFRYWNNLLMVNSSSNLNDLKISPYILNQIKNYEDFFLISLIRHPEIKSSIDGISINYISVNFPKVKITKEVVSSSPETPNIDDKKTDQEDKTNYLKLDKHSLDVIKQRLTYKYPFDNLTSIPSKISVSELLKKHSNNFAFKKKPKLFFKNNLTGAEKGDILHKFMQFANYAAAKSDLKSECKRLLDEEFLSQLEYDNLDFIKLKNFFNSELYQMISSAQKIHREIRFIFPFPLSEISHYLNKPEIKNQTDIIIQGVADCVIENEDNIIIVDYKTDKVDSIADLLDRYKDQLVIYQKALSAIFNKKSSKMIIYSFYLTDYHVIAGNADNVG